MTMDMPGKRRYQKLPPESERPTDPTTGRPLSDTEMYAQRRVERLEKPDELSQEKVAQLRKRIKDIEAEIPQLESNVKLLPDNHPIRYSAQLRLESLRKELEKATDGLKKAEAEAVTTAQTGQLKQIRSEIDATRRFVVERVMEVEKKILATPEEVTNAAKEITRHLDKVRQGTELKLDAIVNDLLEQPAEPKPEPLPEPEPAQPGKPKRFRIQPSYSGVTGKLAGFFIADPEGHTSRKRKQYIEMILKEFPQEVDEETLEKALVTHTDFTATFTFKERVRPAPARQWWTISTGEGTVAVNGHYEPPATDKARFWEIYHGSVIHDSPEFQEMKTALMGRADRMGLRVKPDRRANIDRYFYALYQAKTPTLLPWFFKTFFE